MSSINNKKIINVLLTERLMNIPSLLKYKSVLEKKIPKYKTFNKINTTLNIFFQNYPSSIFHALIQKSY